MKCIKIPSSVFGTVDSDTPFMTVRRVTDEEAHIAVNHQVNYGPWQYATKKEWKAGGRKCGLPM